MKAATNARAGIIAVSLGSICTLALSTPARADVTVSPARIGFGTQTVGGAGAPVSITLTNTGSRRVRFSNASTSMRAFVYSGPTAFTLQPQQALTVSVAFRPQAAQTYTGSLTFRLSNGGRISVPLSGTGASAVTNNSTTSTSTSASAQPPSITSQPLSKTVIAGQTASFSVGVTGTSPFTYQWTRNDAAISGATSSSYTTPAATTADSGAKFAVMVSNSAGNVTSTPATLTVNAAALTLSSNPSSLSFGNVNVSSSAAQQATLTNTGNGSVTLSGMSVSGAGFSASDASSGQILSPGQSATINVSFQPAAVGSMNGSVTVSSNASSPVVIALSGSGVQLVPHSAMLSWTRSTSTVNGYQVYSSQVSGGPYTRLTPALVSLPSFTDSSVQNGKTYFYVVTAVDSAGGESGYSDQASATIQ